MKTTIFIICITVFIIIQIIQWIAIFRISSKVSRQEEKIHIESKN